MHARGPAAPLPRPARGDRPFDVAPPRPRRVLHDGAFLSGLVLIARRGAAGFSLELFQRYLQLDGARARLSSGVPARFASRSKHRHRADRHSSQCKDAGDPRPHRQGGQLRARSAVRDDPAQCPAVATEGLGHRVSCALTRDRRVASHSRWSGRGEPVAGVQPGTALHRHEWLYRANAVVDTIAREWIQKSSSHCRQASGRSRPSAAQ